MLLQLPVQPGSASHLQMSGNDLVDAIRRVASGQSLLGYQLKTTPSGAGGAAYCAPKLCVNDADCSAAGLCRKDSGGSHCVARSQ